MRNPWILSMVILPWLMVTTSALLLKENVIFNKVKEVSLSRFITEAHDDIGLGRLRFVLRKNTQLYKGAGRKDFNDVQQVCRRGAHSAYYALSSLKRGAKND